MSTQQNRAISGNADPASSDWPDIQFPKYVSSNPRQREQATDLSVLGYASPMADRRE
jgi:hypothetical protein